MRPWLRRVMIVVAWAGGAALLAVGANLRNPYLLSVRAHGPVAVTALAALALLVLWLRPLHRRRLAHGVLLALWVAAPLWAGADRLAFEAARQRVLARNDEAARTLGRHFVVGYSQADAVMALAARGLIGGVFVSRVNAAGRSADALRAEIAALQQARAAAGLPALIVAADQEGGIVSRLSPPLTALPPLATLATLPPAQRAAAVAAYGARQGRELAALGVTLNLAPVVDLQPDRPTGALDLHSLIGQRAIGRDPVLVAEIALGYSRALNAAGVRPTLKHFPGLGRIAADTHHFAAGLAATSGELEHTDWLPFRRVLAETDAVLMLGHVTVTAIDPDRPASRSRRVVELLRKGWGYDGPLITDDMTMAPVYRSGLCDAAIEALNAGIDLLLLSYDAEQYYPTMACALDALRDGRLILPPAETERASAAIR
jgi:beta-N-acetylhexosaminidase